LIPASSKLIFSFNVHLAVQTERRTEQFTHTASTSNIDIVRVGLNYRFWGGPWGGKSPPPVVTK
jgi:hypothetical protein